MDKKNQHINSTEQRKKDFNKKLFEGDEESVKKFAISCTDMGDEEFNRMQEKLDSVIEQCSEIITKEFSLDELKALDGKSIPDEMAQILLNSNYVDDVYVTSMLCNEDESVAMYPVFVKLIDGTSIRILTYEVDDEYDESDS